jgi:GNAT superfamily N-acetyltransferase
LRPATADDLPAINAVVEAAVMTWKLPERVKRLALPSYRYNPLDLSHLGIVLVEAAGHGVVGVAGWEPADSHDTPPGRRGLLLHGLYVDPRWQGAGLGTRLLQAAIAAARDQGFDGLLVKAQADAEVFFAKRGLRPLPVDDPERDYVHRYWLDI